MINELFNEKILPYNPPVRPARVIDFLEKLKTISEIEENMKAFREINRTISIFKNEPPTDYVSYIRFYNFNSDYRIGYFMDDIDATYSAQVSIDQFLDHGYTETDEISILKFTELPSIEDVFNQINESYNDSSTIDELFDYKILVFESPVKKDEAIRFLEKIKTISILEKKKETLDEINKVILSLNRVDVHVLYFRFYKTSEGKYTISYYLHYDNDGIIDDEVMSNFEHYLNEFLEEGYTIINEKDVLDIPDLPSIEDVFNQLNESNTYNDYIPLTKEYWYHKVIIFDRNASEEDIQKVYDFLISLGVKGFGPVPDDYLDEAYSFLQEYGHLYFKIYKVQKTYRINYDWDSDNYSAISSENVFTYSDVLVLIDVTKQNVYDILDKLNENTETLKTPREGDFLVCHTPLVMSDDGEVCSIKGKHYEIVKIRSNKDLDIMSECYNHTFSSDADSDYWYGIWFDLFTKEEKNEISGIIDNIFDEL
jgi:hypothetical protein